MNTLAQEIPQPSVVSPTRVTGLSGNEIYCLDRLGLRPGNLCIGNSVFALGVMKSLTSGLRTLAGGEVPEVTNLIREGRTKAFDRMSGEARRHGGLGITGVSNELVNHGTNIEFLSVGSAAHRKTGPDGKMAFSTAATAQELYCQLDAGFKPVRFVLGNVAYSIGVGGNIGGLFRSLSRGEVTEFSQIFDQTRHLALTRLTEEAKRCRANAVIGIKTTVTPLIGTHEMLMIGTASSHPALVGYAGNPVTSALTNEEMWNLVHMGYLPLRLVMGVSVYSLGLVGGFTSTFRSLVRGEINTMTRLIYEAREKALDRVQRDARQWGADEVVGVKTHVYDLGGGLIEFFAIGTAVKKVDKAATRNQSLPPQAIIRDRDTFFDEQGLGVRLGANRTASASSTLIGPIVMLLVGLAVAINVVLNLIGHHHG